MQTNHPPTPQQTYYKKTIKKYRNTHKAVGWGSRESQWRRFDTIASQIATTQFNNQAVSILDVGCGLGDLYHYLKVKKCKCQYKGIDFCEDMIKSAKKSYPNGNFYHASLDNYIETSTIVVANGVFNMKQNNQYAYLKSAISNLLRLASSQVVLTLLSHQTPIQCKQEKIFFYYDPAQIDPQLSHINAIKKWVHGYLPNDMLLSLTLTPGLNTASQGNTIKR